MTAPAARFRGRSFLQRPDHWALAGLMLIGAALRLAYLAKGLPALVDVDAFKFVEPAMAMARTGDLLPHHYQNPGLYPNLLAILLRWLHAGEPAAAHWVARAFSALLGTGLIAIAWAGARRVTTRMASLAAALLVALEPGLVTASRTASTDLLLTVLMTGALVWTASRSPRLRTVLWAGVCSGLAVGTKWTALALAPILIVVTLTDTLRAADRRWPWRRLLIGGLVALPVFLLTTPYLIPHFGQYLERFQMEMLIQHHGQIGRVQGGLLDYFISTTPTWEQPWLGTSLRMNWGWPLLGGALLGVALGLGGRLGRGGRVYALAVTIYLLLVIRPGAVKAYRFLLPILPLLLILASAAVAWMARWTPPRGRPWLTVLLLGGLVLVPALRTIRYARTWPQPFTNTLAAQWLQERLPAGAVVLLSPFFVDNLASLPNETIFLDGAGGRVYRVPDDPRNNGERAPLYPPELIDQMRQQGIDYLVTNSYFDDAFAPVPENLRWFPRSTGANAAFRRRLAAQGERLAHWEGWRAGRPGPDIAVWRLHQD